MTSRHTLAVLCLVLALRLHAAAPAGPDWVLTPRVIQQLSGTAKLQPQSWVSLSATAQGPAASLLRAMRPSLPDGKLPTEGYLLEIGPAGVQVIYKDKAARAWAAETLRLLEHRQSLQSIRIADWPEFSTRAFHLIVGTPKALPGVKRLVKEFLAPRRVNTFIFEIGYAFDFKSDPKVRENVYFTKEEIRDFVAYCRGFGIKVIPEVNSLGHQSWLKESVGGLLTAHPELEEIPDASSPEADEQGAHFYCKSWCPLHPDLHKILFPLFDELIDAFQSDTFHVGTDEVFVLGSDKCPRCKGKDKAELYATAVGDMYKHLHAKGQRVMIWGDRLLDSQATGYSRWDASDLGTYKAAAKLPKDLIVCDWHYAYRDSYPSLTVLAEAGFTVLPTTYGDPRAAAQFVKQAALGRHPKVSGVVASVWYPGLVAAAAAFPDDASYLSLDPHTGETLSADKLRKVVPNDLKILKAAEQTLQAAWNPASVDTEVHWPPYSWKGPWAVPGHIEAEDFNMGGEGKGYHDSNALNEGGQYRNEGVDVRQNSDKGESGLNVGWNDEGEWLDYDVVVADGGSYVIDLRSSSPAGGGVVAFASDGNELTHITVPATGDWDKWQTVTSAPFKLSQGKQTLRVSIVKSGLDLNWYELRKLP